MLTVRQIESELRRFIGYGGNMTHNGHSFVISYYNYSGSGATIEAALASLKGSMK